MTYADDVGATLDETLEFGESYEGGGGPEGVRVVASPTGYGGGLGRGGGQKTEVVNGGVKAFGHGCNANRRHDQRICKPLALGANAWMEAA